MSPLTIAEAFGPRPHGEESHPDLVDKPGHIGPPVPKLSTSSERLLAEMLRDEGI